MTSSVVQTVPIGRIELDSAHRVLKACTPQRQRQALPYLLALYSFIHWWEDSASLQVPDGRSTTIPADLAPASTLISSDTDLTTTWCERPEILELINIAELSLHGSRLAIYPVDAQNQLLIHYPTLLNIAIADFCIGVDIDTHCQQATIVGFISVETLKIYHQFQPATSQGFFKLPLANLLPPSHFLDALQQQARHQTPIQPPSSSLLDSAEVEQALEHLSYLGVSPFAVPTWDIQMAIKVLHNAQLCQRVLAIHQLSRAFQQYGEQQQLTQPV